ncbi:MAG: M15 family metallopeptidase [Myxococcota bacterium]
MPNRLLTLVLVCTLGCPRAEVRRTPPDHPDVSWPLPVATRERITGASWRPGCPVPREELALVRVRHLGLDGVEKAGELVVHVEVAVEVAEAFAEMLRARFPVEQVRLIEDFDASDDRSMEHNNTSAFMCRPNTTRPGQWSKHSYGRAVDINPRLNPYSNPRPVRVDATGAWGPDDKPTRVLPPVALTFLDRRVLQPGMITEGDACHRAFTQRGWTWGGSWKDRVDYQHFEKPPR